MKVEPAAFIGLYATIGYEYVVGPVISKLASTILPKTYETLFTSSRFLGIPTMGFKGTFATIIFFARLHRCSCRREEHARTD